MVYDPIRDCDVPSPAISRRPSIWETPPATAPHSAEGSHPPPPPAFGSDRQSPAASPSVRPPSGAGLRSLLNDENVSNPRRGSDVTTSSTDDEQHSRPRSARLRNESGASSRPGQAHSHGAGSERSPGLSSPENAFAPPPLTSRVTRSPLISPRAPPVSLSSPASTTGGVLAYDSHQHYAGSSSRRSSIDTQRSTMPPPAEPVRHDSVGGQSYQSTAARRSPSTSASVSPRGLTAHLQPTLSRQSSSSRSNGERSRAPVLSSPEAPPPRQLSEEHHPAAAPVSNGRPLKRKYEPSSHAPSRKPITPEELDRLRDAAVQNNPLRRKAMQRPSWSAQSPRDHDHDSGPPRSQGPSRRGSSASTSGRPPADPSVGSKRSSEDVNVDTDTRDAKVQRQSYTGNAAAVASHCE